MVDLEQAALNSERLLARAEDGLDEAEELERLWSSLDAVDRDEFLIEWPATNDVLMRLAALSQAGRLSGTQVERYNAIHLRRLRLDPIISRVVGVPAEARR